MTSTTLQIPGDAFNCAVNVHLMPPVLNVYSTDLVIPANLNNDFRIYIPSYQDITDATWRRDVWRGAAYDLNNSMSVGGIWGGDSMIPGQFEHRHR